VVKRLMAGISLIAIAVTACGDNRERQLDELFAAYQGDDVPGAAVMIAWDGKPAIARTWGMANIEDGVPVGTDTNFRLASITKQFTAICILMLRERGELQLDARLSDVFDNFPEYGRNITLQNLLQHTSGLIDYESRIPDDFEGQVSDHDALRMMTEVDRTYFEPGSKYQYSNTGYAMLAVLVENISGMRRAHRRLDRSGASSNRGRRTPRQGRRGDADRCPDLGRTSEARARCRLTCALARPDGSRTGAPHP
jgi:CubicO group peptidase (beta-lactamase class C family)